MAADKLEESGQEDREGVIVSHVDGWESFRRRRIKLRAVVEEGSKSDLDCGGYIYKTGRRAYNSHLLISIHPSICPFANHIYSTGLQGWYWVDGGGGYAFPGPRLEGVAYIKGIHSA